VEQDAATAHGGDPGHGPQRGGAGVGPDEPGQLGGHGGAPAQGDLELGPRVGAGGQLEVPAFVIAAPPAAQGDPGPDQPQVIGVEVLGDQPELLGVGLAGDVREPGEVGHDGVGVGLVLAFGLKCRGNHQPSPTHAGRLRLHPQAAAMAVAPSRLLMSAMKLLVGWTGKSHSISTGVPPGSSIRTMTGVLPGWAWRMCLSSATSFSSTFSSCSAMTTGGPPLSRTAPRYRMVMSWAKLLTAPSRSLIRPRTLTATSSAS